MSEGVNTDIQPWARMSGGANMYNIISQFWTRASEGFGIDV